MTLAALPTFYPQIQDPEGNLADLLYLGPNDSPIGVGQPMVVPDLPSFQGLIVPDVLEQNRVLAGQALAVPLILGLQDYRHNQQPLRAGLMALFGYMAPLPAAVVYLAMRAMRR